MATDWSGTGFVQVRTFAANSAVPVAGVLVQILTHDGTVAYQGETDENGIFENITLPCPPASLSLTPGATEPPYGTYNITAQVNGYVSLTVDDFQVFDGVTTLAELAMEPESTTARASSTAPQPDITTVPPHSLFAGAGGSGTSPLDTCPVAPVLVQSDVIIPQKITVHLGKPTASAQNVTVNFTDYLKNVASSEVYPTWPEEALRANIHAQISLALNRIYTEWYRSKGYSFDITNSTAYDQYYVHGREIFAVMSTLVDDIFNTYVRKTGTVNPFYTEYFDGQSVSCSGMKQWGTVTQANQGKNALQILKYYYGSDIEIVRTNNIGAVPESYPGTPLRLGSNSIYVKIIQRQLNRIAKNYPSFGSTEVDGIFGTATQSMVKKFQTQFSLTADGVVGRSTWYKISYIYVAVKKLAELTSEGEAPTGGLVDGVYPGTALKTGSTGNNVYQMQFWLNEVAGVTPEIPSLAVDGIFGAGTEASVRAFQKKFGLSQDGVVGLSTWNAIYAQFISLEGDSNPDVNFPGEFPGTTLAPGSTGDNVRVMQFWLSMVSRFNSAIPSLAVDGIFGPGTLASVRAFQSFYGLSVDGLVGRQTWNKLYEVYTSLVDGLLEPTARPGTYPGTPLQVGSTGTAVKEMQYYLFLLSAYYSSIPVVAYDGIFGASTKSAVKAFQTLAGLTSDGIVGPVTWSSIYAKFSTLRSVDGPVGALMVDVWPGTVLRAPTLATAAIATGTLCTCGAPKENPTFSSEGNAVKKAQIMLLFVGAFFDAILPISGVTGVYDEEMALSVESFQTLYGLPVTGEIDEATWNALEAAYFSAAGDKGEAGLNSAEGVYPGFVLEVGSAGVYVEELQAWMNSIATRYCQTNFVPVNGIFDTATRTAVEKFQEGFGISITGSVDRITWDAIYNYYLYEILGPGE